MSKLETGLSFHQQGDLENAHRHYQEHLKHYPNDSTALELLSLCFAAQGKLVEAAQMLSSIGSPSSTQLFVLGQYQSQLNLVHEATESFKSAIRLDPTNVELYKSLINLFISHKVFDKAIVYLDKADQHIANNSKLALLKAKLFRESEQYDEAISLYKKLLKRQPRSVVLRHAMALSLRMSGSPSEALSIYSTLEKEGIKQFQLFHNKANALSDLAQYNDAILYYKKALELNPLYAESHHNLNELYWETKNSSQFLKSYQSVLENHPENIEVALSFISTLINAKRFQEVLDYSQSGRVKPELSATEQYRVLLGRALKGVGELNKASQLQRSILDSPIKDVSTLLELCETFLEQRDLDLSAQMLQQVFAMDPANQHGWALQGILWHLQGDHRAESLNDYDKLVKEYTIEVPKGFESIDAFCSELKEYLRSIHRGSQEPLEQTLVHGTQTRGNLFNDSNPLIVKLVNEFKVCIQDYLHTTCSVESTPNNIIPDIHIKSVDDIKFSGSWSVNLNDNGFHTPHIHPMGCISSVFYVDLPKAIENEQQKQGWFQLGKPIIPLNGNEPKEKLIKPTVGKLILFRSYMWHGTRPFKSTESRITVAFDVKRPIKL